MARPRRVLVVPEVENHNSGQWLRVVYRSTRPRGSRVRAYGWYVVRTCPCHDQVPVSDAYDSEARAERAMRALIEVSMRAWDGDE